MTQATHGDRPYTPAQAAEYLQVSREIVYRLLNNGELKAKKIGGQWRITRKALDALLYNDDAGVPSDKESICLTGEKEAGTGGSLLTEYESLLGLKNTKTQRPLRAA